MGFHLLVNSPFGGCGDHFGNQTKGDQYYVGGSNIDSCIDSKQQRPGNRKQEEDEEPGTRHGSRRILPK